MSKPTTRSRVSVEKEVERTMAETQVQEASGWGKGSSNVGPGLSIGGDLALPFARHSLLLELENIGRV